MSNLPSVWWPFTIPWRKLRTPGKYFTSFATHFQRNYIPKNVSSNRTVLIWLKSFQKETRKARKMPAGLWGGSAGRRVGFGGKLAEALESGSFWREVVAICRPHCTHFLTSTWPTTLLPTPRSDSPYLPCRHPFTSTLKVTNWRPPGRPAWLLLHRKSVGSNPGKGWWEKINHVLSFFFFPLFWSKFTEVFNSGSQGS